MARPGRKRGQLSQAKLDLREAAKPYAALALRTLARVCREGDSDSARVSAANALLDRGYGRPIQAHRVAGLDDTPIPFQDMSNDAEAFSRRLAGLAAAIGSEKGTE